MEAGLHNRADRGLSKAMGGALVDAVAMAVLLGVIALVLTSAGVAWQRTGVQAAIILTAVVSLQIFSGNTGIVSFGHAGFVGLGAYAVGLLTMSASVQASALRNLPAFLAGHEMSLLAALGIVVLLGIVVGLVSGAPLFRLSGSGASIATLALLIIVYTLLVASRDITRGSQPFYGVPRGVGLWTAVPIAAAALAFARIFRELPIGLSARAAADDERGAAAIGVDRRFTAMFTWAASIVVAMVAGGMMAQFLGAFSPKDFYFELAFTTLAMLIVGGMTSSLGALSGVVVTTVVIEFVRRIEGGGEIGGIVIPHIFGLTEAVLALSMILIIWRRPEGLCGGRELNLLKRLGLSRPPAVAAEPPPRTERLTIRAEKLTKRYAGVVAVDEASVELPTDRITGIIGPNGAGKTTLINMLAGAVEPTSGTLAIAGKPVTRFAANRFARAGLGRTFQNIRIFPRMTLLENVLVAARQVVPGLAAAEQAAMRELARVGLAHLADQPAASLPYGLRRRLEVARALALDPAFLVLDEPAAGMNPVETEGLMAMLAEVRTERRLGIVLIEHDLKLVMKLCDRIVVVDHGRVIAEGTPAEVQANPDVIAAYLGSRTGARVLKQTEQETGPSTTTGEFSHA
ncbi:branched-chain amino acid transport system permease protein [Pseudoxanthobacter soli DSM 19599]|uniref:Branched-chain amino acid transport system permease protein n=1 Tax=Pseudoxanthobacter soli DSM 19599 TaxID=1123029 RepID=A0A1M7ZM42_9HYPH|nr:branched-chain amino acid ABC transporter ATP-binding protein/permease [Pseudoxanthobacter soli]SHO65947.1 branched-chain amino acid transport system permease protein [Pseudoxanthobacter soli DSM 19599]